MNPSAPGQPEPSTEAAPTTERTDDARLIAALADARSVESPALVLARARVGGALFGAAVGLGRFRVLERLGGGGMGSSTRRTIPSSIAASRSRRCTCRAQGAS